jgi:hypothetical protein
MLKYLEQNRSKQSIHLRAKETGDAKFVFETHFWKITLRKQKPLSLSLSKWDL